MVVGAQVLDQVVLTREAIATLARAVFNGAIAEDGEVHARLVALQVREAGEGLAAAVAAKGLSGFGLRRRGMRVRGRVIARDGEGGRGNLFAGQVPATASARASAAAAGGAGDAGGHGRGVVDGVLGHARVHVWGAGEGVDLGHDLGHSEGTGGIEVNHVVIDGLGPVEEEVHAPGRGGGRV